MTEIQLGVPASNLVKGDRFSVVGLYPSSSKLVFRVITAHDDLIRSVEIGTEDSSLTLDPSRVRVMIYPSDNVDVTQPGT